MAYPQTSRSNQIHSNTSKRKGRSVTQWFMSSPKSSISKTLTYFQIISNRVPTIPDLLRLRFPQQLLRSEIHKADLKVIGRSQCRSFTWSNNDMWTCVPRNPKYWNMTNTQLYVCLFFSGSKNMSSSPLYVLGNLFYVKENNTCSRRFQAKPHLLCTWRGGSGAFWLRCI